MIQNGRKLEVDEERKGHQRNSDQSGQMQCSFLFSNNFVPQICVSGTCVLHTLIYHVRDVCVYVCLSHFLLICWLKYLPNPIKCFIRTKKKSCDKNIYRIFMDFGIDFYRSC